MNAMHIDQQHILGGSFKSFEYNSPRPGDHLCLIHDIVITRDEVSHPHLATSGGRG